MQSLKCHYQSNVSTVTYNYVYQYQSSARTYNLLNCMLLLFSGLPSSRHYRLQGKHNSAMVNIWSASTQCVYTQAVIPQNRKNLVKATHSFSPINIFLQILPTEKIFVKHFLHPTNSYYMNGCKSVIYTIHSIHNKAKSHRQHNYTRTRYYNYRVDKLIWQAIIAITAADST